PSPRRPGARAASVPPDADLRSERIRRHDRKGENENAARRASRPPRRNGRPCAGAGRERARRPDAGARRGRLAEGSAAAGREDDGGHGGPRRSARASRLGTCPCAVARTRRRHRTGAAGGAVHVPAVVIKDRPRFPWRGLLIDAARHWQPVEVIKRTLDGMSSVKMNVLHWHLTEDQGFRVESKRYPKLHGQG